MDAAFDQRGGAHDEEEVLSLLDRGLGLAPMVLVLTLKVVRVLLTRHARMVPLA